MRIAVVPKEMQELPPKGGSGWAWKAEHQPAANTFKGKLQRSEGSQDWILSTGRIRQMEGRPSRRAVARRKSEVTTWGSLQVC